MRLAKPTGFSASLLKSISVDSKKASLASPLIVVSAAIASSTSLAIVSTVSSKLEFAYTKASTTNDKLRSNNLSVWITKGSEVSSFV